VRLGIQPQFRATLARSRSALGAAVTMIGSGRHRRRCFRPCLGTTTASDSLPAPIHFPAPYRLQDGLSAPIAGRFGRGSLSSSPPPPSQRSAPSTPGSSSRLRSRLFTASMAFTGNRPARLSLMSNRRGRLRSRYGPLICLPTGAFDAGLRPDPFPDQTASLLPGFLAATRNRTHTGRRRRASDQDKTVGRSPLNHWTHRLEYSLRGCGIDEIAAELRPQWQLRTGSSLMGRHNPAEPRRKRPVLSDADNHLPEVGVLLRRVRVRVEVSCGRSVVSSRSRIFSAAARRTGSGE
jgi:hypothetical protein